MEDFFKERRRFPRVDRNLSVSYRNLKTKTVESIGALAQNISEGGVKFVANEFMPLATRLVVEISLPQSPRPVKAIAKIAWITKMPMNDRYILGNQFLDVTREDRRVIADFVNANFSY